MKALAMHTQRLLPPEHALFNHCHASTIVRLSDGGLLVAFFAGLREGAGDVAIWLSRLRPDARQGRWSAPVRRVAEAGVAHWNLVLHATEDAVWLFYKVGATVHDWVTRVIVSRDGGEHWSAPRPLVAGDRLPRGPVRNKLLVMSNGEWIAPASIETETSWDAFVDISSDGGAHWEKHDVPFEHARPAEERPDEAVWSGLAANALWESDARRVFKWDGVIQPTLWESSPGCLHMLMRSTRGRIYRSDSADYGRTWRTAYATPLPNNNSGIDLVRLADGRLVLAFNPVGGNWGPRFPISLAWSADNGRSWARLIDMEETEGEFSYPAIIADGLDLHVTYTADRRNIVYRRIAVE